MQTIRKTHPLTNKAVEAVKFEVWTWRKGARCCAASPDLPGTYIETQGSMADACKICFIRVCEIVNESKNKKTAPGWRKWRPPVVGVHAVKRYSIA